MPYLNCPECRLTVYSAAAYSTVDRCPRCEAPLGAAPRRLFDAAAPDGQARAGALGEDQDPTDADDSSH